MDSLHAEMIKVHNAIKAYGGSFMNALADAMVAADDSNLAKIRDTWRKEWDSYLLMYDMHVPGSVLDEVINAS